MNYFMKLRKRKKMIKLLLLLLSLNLFAAHIDDFSQEMGFYRDYTTAISKAKKDNKLLVMVLSADYCPWCRKFENKTLKSTIVKSRLSSEVITLVVDKKFDVKSFPEKFTTQFSIFHKCINSLSVGFTE